MSESRQQLEALLLPWFDAWNRHDFDTVMALFDSDVVFEHWTGARVEGREALREAWREWFSAHGNFNFETEDLFIDAEAGKVLYRWRLSWPSLEPGFEGRREVRRGVDVLHVRAGVITSKLTYSKCIVDIEGERVRLRPAG